jgi:YVTN family beta-propeller protein
MACSAAPAGYHLLKKIALPGDGGWDYLAVDTAGRKLYVSHGKEVEVVNIDSGQVAGQIPNTKGVHGVAIAPDSKRGFTSNGGSNTSTIFSLDTLKPIAEVPTGEKPDALIYDPATHRVFVNNGGSNNTTVIDAASGKVVGTIDLGGAPEFSAADGKGHVFTNLEDKSEAVKLDAKNLKVEQRWKLAPCDSPSSMAMDPKSNRLFIGCRNHLMAVVDASNGKVITTMPIGDHVDATVFDPSTGLVFFSNGDGTINIFHEDSPDKYSAVETVKTEPGAKTMAFDPKTGHLFLSAAERMPPAPGSKRPGAVKPGSFTVLVVGKN